MYGRTEDIVEIQEGNLVDNIDLACNAENMDDDNLHFTTLISKYSKNPAIDGNNDGAHLTGPQAGPRSSDRNARLPSGSNSLHMTEPELQDSKTFFLLNCRFGCSVETLYGRWQL
jgi:hypothetical protein